METLKLKSPSLKNFNLEAESISLEFFDKPFNERSELIIEPVIEQEKKNTAPDTEYELILKISEFETSEYKWPLELLTNYISNNYHNNLSKKNVEILKLTRRNYELNEEVNPLIFNFNLHFLKLTEELNNHLKLQEEVLFPAINKLISTGSCRTVLNDTSLKEAVKEANQNQDEIVRKLNTIKKLRENFSFYGITTSFYKILNSFSIEYEKAVNFLLHLEKSILYPEALFLEEEAQIWD